jgi:hypothetical protein
VQRRNAAVDGRLQRLSDEECQRTSVSVPSCALKTLTIRGNWRHVCDHSM